MNKKKQIQFILKSFLNNNSINIITSKITTNITTTSTKTVYIMRENS